jgi:hypothetical protein
VKQNFYKRSTNHYSCICASSPANTHLPGPQVRAPTPFVSRAAFPQRDITGNQNVPRVRRAVDTSRTAQAEVRERASRKHDAHKQARHRRAAAHAGTDTGGRGDERAQECRSCYLRSAHATRESPTCREPGVLEISRTRAVAGRCCPAWLCVGSGSGNHPAPSTAVFM